MTSPVAIVTGASAGIGLAIARAMTTEGYLTVMTGRDPDRLRQAAESITTGPVEERQVDAADAAAMRTLVAETAAKHGRLDVLVNNAGRADVVPIQRTGDALASEVLAVNTLGPLAAISAAWPTFKSQKAGRVISVSSWAAQDPFPGFGIYGASKAAVNALTRSAHNEGAAMGVLAHAIGPGAVETAMLRSSFNEKAVPESMCLAPEDIAALALSIVRGERDNDAGRCLYIRRGSDGSVEVTVGD